MGIWSKGLDRSKTGEPRLEENNNAEAPIGMMFLISKTILEEKETQIVSIDNLPEYIHLINEFHGSDNNVIIYRGQADVSWPLLPKIGRHPLKSSFVEKDIFLEFKRNYRLYYNQVLTKDMDILMLGQHYGLPTRLLDWTTAPLVALYFACCSNRNTDGVVYLKELDSQNRYIDEKRDLDPFSYQGNIFIFPEVFEKRFENQNGLFEYFANPCSESNASIRTKITIPAINKDSIIEQLTILNLDLLELFPTLDNLCKAIETQYIRKH